MSTLNGTLPLLTGACTNAVPVIPTFQPGAFQFGAFQMEQPGYLVGVLPRLGGAFASVGAGPDVELRGGGSAWWLPPLPKLEPRWWEPQPVDPVVGEFAAALPVPLAAFDDDLTDDEIEAAILAAVTSIAA
ncbi:hypothetical protein [Methyloceanibacter sp. wino2]|uniref:hypothetical protein n=1 Tax=Methyloceanibacter sp. wino2 TaxID=2170729 RepID=UPI000D3E11D6|nr:hypothetical protein [Methyloceanibacter sp. wino2]